MYGERQPSTHFPHITYPLIFSVTYPNVGLTLKPPPSKPRCCCMAIIIDSHFEARPSTPDSKLAKQNEIARGFAQLLQQNIGIHLSTRLCLSCESNFMEQRLFWEVNIRSAGQVTAFIKESAKDK